MLRRGGAIALACAAALGAPAAAQAAAIDAVLQEFTTTGKIDACQHTAAELAQAKAHVPKDIARRAAGFPAALDAAIAQRNAPGACAAQQDATPAATATQPAQTQATPAPAAPQTQPATAPASRASGDGSSLRVALLVAVGALAVIAVLLWAFARWWAWEPAWLPRWRHAMAEAGWRASAAWAEFTDWLRFGR